MVQALLTKYNISVREIQALSVGHTTKIKQFIRALINLFLENGYKYLVFRIHFFFTFNFLIIK
jgi:hypothetical protein